MMPFPFFVGFRTIYIGLNVDICLKHNIIDVLMTYVSNNEE